MEKAILMVKMIMNYGIPWESMGFLCFFFVFFGYPTDTASCRAPGHLPCATDLQLRLQSEHGRGGDSEGRDAGTVEMKQLLDPKLVDGLNMFEIDWNIL